MTEQTTIPDRATVDSIRTGRREVEAELGRARDDYSAASLNLAMDRDNPARTADVIDARQRIDRLTAELDGLRAASGEVEKREAAVDVEQRVQDVDQRAHAASRALEAAHKAFSAAVDAVNTASAAWIAARKTAGTAELLLQEIAYAPHGQFMAPRVMPEVDTLLTGLLWHHLGSLDVDRSDVVMDVTGERHPNRPAEIMTRQVTHGQREIDRGRAAHLARLQPAAARKH